MTVFRLPDVGEGLHEAELVAWHVAVGDHVVADQPLVSVETAKAVVEIPSPQSGHIAALHGAPGDVVPVGTVLVEFADGAHVDTGSVVGELDEDAGRPSIARTPARRVGATGGGVKASPAVRSLASRLGVDLAGVTGTGAVGTITRGDVEMAAARAAAPSAEPLREGDTLEPLRGVRRAMDANMARAHTQVVPASVTDEADIGDWPEGTDVTLRLIRAIAVACRAEPAINASYLGRDTGRVLHDYVDLGIAVDTPDGLFVPVLRDVANRDPEDLRQGLEAMKADVRARTVAPEHLRGQTITLSNFGAIAGRHAALVVVPPQVAIVGAGRARDAVVAQHGHAVVTRVLPLSLTFDHRVVMGGEATRFLRALIADLQST
jgi:pyruvate dehydrogenase E2 component (dihydrolipoamide acetyltransferase)